MVPAFASGRGAWVDLNFEGISFKFPGVIRDGHIICGFSSNRGEGEFHSFSEHVEETVGRGFGLVEAWSWTQQKGVALVCFSIRGVRYKAIRALCGSSIVLGDCTFAQGSHHVTELGLCDALVSDGVGVFDAFWWLVFGCDQGFEFIEARVLYMKVVI